MKPKLTALQIRAVHKYKPLKLYKFLIRFWNDYLIHWFTFLIFYSIFMFILGLIIGQNLFILFQIVFYIGYFIAALYFFVILAEEYNMKRRYKEAKLTRKEFMKALTMINYVYHPENDDIK